MLRLFLRGAPRVYDACGHRAEVSSRKGMALLALLALSGREECSRNWVQSMLWSTRSLRQAQSSLRRELSELKKLLNSEEFEAVQSTRHSIWLDRSKIWVDVLHDDDPSRGSLLEGIDLADEEEFEDWLRNLRSLYPEEAHAEPKKAAAQTTGDLAPMLYIHACVSSIGPVDEESALAADATLLDLLTRQKWLQIATPSDPLAMSRCRYHLRTRIDRVGIQLRVSLILSEAPTGLAIWSHNFVTRRDELTSDEQFLIVANTLAYFIDRHEVTHFPNDTVDGLLRTVRVELATLRPDTLDRVADLLAEGRAWGELHVEAEISRLKADIIRASLENWKDEAYEELRARSIALADASPMDGRIFLSSAMANWERGAIAEAENYCNRAIELNPALASALALKAAILLKRGKVQEGRRSYEAAVRIGVNDPHRRMIVSGFKSISHVFQKPEAEFELARAS